MFKTKIGSIADINSESLSDKENWKTINYLDTGSITKNSIESLKSLIVGVDEIPSRAKRKYACLCS